MANKEQPAATSPQRAALQEGHARFNLATMSGVFPGTRTALYQRVQVERQDTRSEPAGDRFWLQLLWYPDPPRVVAYPLNASGATKDVEPFLTWRVTERQHFNQQLQKGLLHNGCTLRSCGSCAHWQAQTDVNPDGLPVGQCQWRASETNGERSDTAVLPQFSNQSHLAPACAHWQGAVTVERSVASASAANEKRTAPPLRRAAEDAAIRHSLGWRLHRRLRRWWQQRSGAAKEAQGSPARWQAALVERSGVGAGTEPCLTCQGRIANLGALTVATTEDDKQTFSIWRCRNCYALYLNNWIDRWERLDSLETEESYYRIAPHEAVTLLTLIQAHNGGEHPGRRHERTATRHLFLDFIHDRTPLSHQIRQGR